MTQQPVTQPPHPGSWVPPEQMVGTKSFVATWLLSWLLGGLGIDRFYLGKIGTGILKLITFGGFGIWYLIDLILTLAGVQKDKSGYRLQGYDENKKIAWIVTAACIVLGMVFGGVSQALSPSVQPESAPTSEVAEAADDEAIDEEPAAEEQVEEAEPAEAPAVEETEEPAVAEEEPVDDPEPVEEAVAEPEPEEDTSDVPAEYRSALTKAETYSDMMSMSKAGIYDQLTSDYGEGFSTEAAQYAIDNVDADWNANALEKARTYQDDMAMSPNAIHDQLTSDYGEQFTQSQADYAIEHLND